jgi:putative Mn2+ efflux pump MntP
MDSFHGCYEDTTHDYRHFATLYLAVRFLNLLMSSVFNFTLYLPAAALVFVFALALVAKFQPYKHKRNNTVDIILLLAIISAFISLAMHYVGEFMYPKWLNGITVVIFALIIVCYLVFLILACVLPRAIQCCKKCKIKTSSEVNEGDRALLNHESTDYNSYS